MTTLDDILDLAKLLEIEWNGGSIDRGRARELAERLLPQMPELSHTLTCVRNRMVR